MQNQRKADVFEICPISGTSIDWQRFVTAANRSLGRSPTRELDNANITPGLVQSFIPALGEFAHKGTTPTQAMKNCDAYLKHVSFGFLVSTSRELMHQILISGQDFAIIMAEPGRHKENYIITGSLYTWRKAIIDGCQEKADPELREFTNAMWTFFSNFGFSEIFSSHRRRDIKDTTWVLDCKR